MDLETDTGRSEGEGRIATAVAKEPAVHPLHKTVSIDD
jgi:hypothetical protein